MNSVLTTLTRSTKAFTLTALCQRHRMKIMPLLLGYCALFASTGANAHYPLMTCSTQDTAISCEAGFSDGSPATNKKVQVLDYNDQVLLQLKTDQRSQVIFQRPTGEFYIRFDAGHETPVEIDYDEL